MILDSEQLERAIALQERAYGLCRWIADHANGRQLRGTMSQHTGMSTAEAAEEWISRRYDMLPAEFRPERAQIHAFASLVAALVGTSMEPRHSVTEPNRCRCTFCGMLGAGIRVRQPSRGAIEAAHALKVLALNELASACGCVLANPDQFVRHAQELGEDISWVAYSRELLRRTEFASQGLGVLCLWRQIAWDPAARGAFRIRNGFELSARRAKEAEERVIGAIRRESIC